MPHASERSLNIGPTSNTPRHTMHAACTACCCRCAFKGLAFRNGLASTGQRQCSRHAGTTSRDRYDARTRTRITDTDTGGKRGAQKKFLLVLLRYFACLTRQAPRAKPETCHRAQASNVLHRSCLILSLDLRSRCRQPGRRVQSHERGSRPKETGSGSLLIPEPESVVAAP